MSPDTQLEGHRHPRLFAVITAALVASVGLAACQSEPEAKPKKEEAVKLSDATLAAGDRVYHDIKICQDADGCPDGSGDIATVRVSFDAPSHLWLGYSETGWTSDRAGAVVTSFGESENPAGVGFYPLFGFNGGDACGVDSIPEDDVLPVSDITKLGPFVKVVKTSEVTLAGRPAKQYDLALQDQCENVNPVDDPDPGGEDPFILVVEPTGSTRATARITDGLPDGSTVTEVIVVPLPELSIEANLFVIDPLPWGSSQRDAEERQAIMDSLQITIAEE